MIELTNGNFEKEIQSGKVVVDCWTNWCGKCKMLKPKLEEIATKRTDYKFCLLDVDKYIAIAEKLNVTNIPTLIVFEDGKEIKRGSFDILNFLEK